MQAIARLMRGFCSLILLAIIVGPILSIKSDPPFTSTNLLLAISIGFIDAVAYSSVLHLFVSTAGPSVVVDEETLNHYEYLRSILAGERKSLQQINETIESSRNTAVTLHELVQSCLDDNQTDARLLQITREKLRTLKFLDTDNAMKIDTSLRDLNGHVQKVETRLSKLLSRGSLVTFSRVNLFILSFAPFLYLHQIVLWLLQYLTITNPSKFGSHALVLAIVNLSQSLGFFYFLQIISTNTSLLSPLSVCICLFCVRSLASIYDLTGPSDIRNKV